MTIIERLDETIRQAEESGASIKEIDLTDTDYADLMEFAKHFDANGLAQMRLDMQAQVYRHYALNFGGRMSHAELDTGESVSVPKAADDAAA